MNTNNKIMGVTITIIMSIVVFFLCVSIRDQGDPRKLYSVYLNGDKIGLIENKQELLDLIDKEQVEIKDKYKVDKVYPPSGLDIQKVVTYDDDVISTTAVYEKIKDIEPFTISGYKVTITYKEPEEDEFSKNDEEKTEESETKEETVQVKDPVTLNVLNKDDFETGFYNTMAAFIGSEQLEKYKNNTQIEITETGSTIENVYWQEDIKIKEDYLSTEEFIYTNSSDISKYLLFGTLEEGKKYKVRDGDDIASVAEANNLNVDEFLVANPQISSSKVLLTKGQEVNTALISPTVNIVYETEKIEDVEVPFETEYQEDDTMYVGDTETIQEGQNGETRVTEKIQFINGEIQGLYITNKKELTPAVNKIVKKGTKTRAYSSGGSYIFYDQSLSVGSWVWPTVTPYVITSRYYWRWGRMHEGIDISGCGHGSPIYSVGDGVVTEAGYGPTNGYYVTISHAQNYYTIYMHLAYNPIVSPGQQVKAGQQIGAMGNTGRSTGTHLHIGVFLGYPYNGGQVLDPCSSIFSC